MALSVRANLLVQVTPGGAGAGNTDHVINRPFGVSTGSVIGTAVQAGGTAQVLRQAGGVGGFVAMTDAAACAAVDAVTAFATIVQAQAQYVIGDVLRLTLAGVATNGRVDLQSFATPIPGNA